jgi:hypothetical protein
MPKAKKKTDQKAEKKSTQKTKSNTMSPILNVGSEVDRDAFKTRSGSQSPIVRSNDGRFVNTNTDKNPSFTNRNLGFSKKGKKYEQAFTLLAQKSTTAIDTIAIAITAIDDTVEKVKFLKACYEVEESGSNPSVHPRTQVMSYLSDALFELGETGGLSNVVEEIDPIVGNVKPLRFVV